MTKESKETKEKEVADVPKVKKATKATKKSKEAEPGMKRHARVLTRDTNICVPGIRRLILSGGSAVRINSKTYHVAVCIIRALTRETTYKSINHTRARMKPNGNPKVMSPRDVRAAILGRV